MDSSSTPIFARPSMKAALALIGLAAFGALAVGGPALGATPTVYAGNATITGAGDIVQVSRMPVQTSSGSILYYDVTTTFGVTSAGALSVVSTTIAPSPSLIVSNFQAGTYASPAGLNFTELLSGPGIGPAGTTAWSFAKSGGSNVGCAYPATATWYTGPISSNPYATRITGAGITTTDYSYGIAGPISSLCSGVVSQEFNGPSNGVAPLIGAAQTGGSLTVVSFTDSTGKDHSVPVAQITFTLSP